MSTALRILVTLSAWTVAGWWILVPHRWEGRVVLVLSETHGVHSHDIVGLTGAVMATAIAWFPWNRALVQR